MALAVGAWLGAGGLADASCAGSSILLAVPGVVIGEAVPVAWVIKPACDVIETGLLLGLLLAVVTTAAGQQPPCVFPRADQVKARVRARVTPAPTGHDYHYLLENQQPAAHAIVKFAVQTLAADGTPVTQISPPDWVAGGRIAFSDFNVWNTFGRPRGLAAGTSAMGFGFTNAAGLPGIVTFLAWNHVESPRFPRGEEPDVCEGSDIIENSFKGKTVGPKPPPQPFVPLEFLNYLIALLHDSRQQGWIRVDGVHQSLLAKLTGAKRKLEAGEGAVAKSMLNAFLNEVQATSCPEFSCPGGKPLTSEAYALLFFNGQFLWERL